MPKNKGLGGKKRRKGRSANNMPQEIVFKINGQEYGQVTKSLGNGYMEVMCFTSDGNILRRAHIRGTMRKRAWMSIGDIVLVNIRDFQDSTCDIALKYTQTEARTLRLKGQIPENIDLTNKDMIADDDPFAFRETGEEDAGSNEDDDNGTIKQNRNLDLPSSRTESETESESKSESDDEVDLNKLL